MKEYYIPKLSNFPPGTQAEILMGDLPFHVGQGAWRPIKPGERAHPGHIIGIIATKKEMVPARLYGPEKEYTEVEPRLTTLQETPFASSGECDLTKTTSFRIQAAGR